MARLLHAMGIETGWGLSGYLPVLWGWEVEGTILVDHRDAGKRRLGVLAGNVRVEGKL